MEKKNIYSYRITNIATTKFLFEDLQLDYFINLIKNKELAMAIDLAIDIKKDINQFSIIIKSIFTDKTEPKTVVEHIGKTSFEINGLSEAYNNTNDSFTLPDDLLMTLVNLAYTHCRALLSAELSSTIYKNELFLPILTPDLLLRKIKDLEIKKEKKIP